MGGVLFIDEASSLYQPDNSKDFGLESIEILLQVMENERDKFIVILAGYKDRMDTFFESNPGMRSRVAHHLDFADYDVDELVAIGRLMLERASYYLSDDAEARLPPSTSPCGCSSRSSPMPAASATSWSGPGCGTRTGWPPTASAAGAATT